MGDRETLLQTIGNIKHDFKTPTKCIHEGTDVSVFLSSKAYADLMTWLLQLNGSVFPRTAQGDTTLVWTVTLTESQYAVIGRLVGLVKQLEQLIDQAPPEPGPRRFGNVAFRTWYRLVESSVEAFLEVALGDIFQRYEHADKARIEITAYLLGSFGSPERLDYGSGHELSFLAFLGGLWKLGAFIASSDLSTERDIVLKVVASYLRLIRRLIITYNLEPAGSHGVWGLDDHSFAPYIFGSAQYAPAISTLAQISPEGSLSSAPDPAAVTNQSTVQRERETNLYFGAIGFIYDVKKGPFWEHSPMLFDISGVKGGWAKINKGMLKMYNAEVLGKFPVVQHFVFGSLFVWERDPTAQSSSSVHLASQPGAAPKNTSATSSSSSTANIVGSRRINPAPGSGFVGTAAPWARSATVQDPASLTSRPAASMPAATASRTASGTGPTAPEPTKAPWAK